MESHVLFISFSSLSGLIAPRKKVAQKNIELVFPETDAEKGRCLTDLTGA